MEFAEYQQRAEATDYNKGDDDAIRGIVAPLLGLAAETGSILNAYKRQFRERITEEDAKIFLKKELGDALWYLNSITTRLGFKLEEVALENLERIEEIYSQEHSPSSFPSLNTGKSTREQFPTEMKFQFKEKRHENGHKIVEVWLIESTPNPFERGWKKGKIVHENGAYKIGDDLNDNTRKDDGFRYHDVIHMTFAAYIGWSPFLRRQLGVQRLDGDEEEWEDNARARFSEEGVVAAVWAMAKSRNDFKSPQSVNEETLEFVDALTDGFEASAVPAWLWRQAISKACTNAKLLKENEGGFITLNTKDRTAVFSRT